MIKVLKATNNAYRRGVDVPLFLAQQAKRNAKWSLSHAGAFDFSFPLINLIPTFAAQFFTEKLQTAE